MKQAEIYGRRVTAPTAAELLDAIGQELAGRVWDPLQCRLLGDDPDEAPETDRVPEPEPEPDEPDAWPVPVNEPDERQAREDALIAQRGDGWASVGVSELGAERATRDAATLTEMGFVVPPPIYAVGSLVNRVGVDNWRRKRREHAERPLLGDAVSQFCATIAAEQRRDYVLTRHGLTISPDGNLLFANGEGTLRFSERSFAQFCQRAGLPNGAAPYLSAVEPDVRAWNLKRWFAANPLPMPIKVRVRHDSEIFAVVGEKFTDYPIDRVASDLANALEDLNLRAQLDYDGSRMQISATAFSDVAPERAVAGEVFTAGITVSSADDGTGASKGGGTAERNLCLNLYIVARMTAGGFSVAHRGGTSTFAERLRQGFDSASTAARHFVAQWGGARQTAPIVGQVRPADGSTRVPETLTDLLWGVWLAEQARGALPIRQNEIAGIWQAWQTEPEPTRQGMANALTRYAHEGQGDAWHAAAIETAAVDMLTSRRPLEWKDPAKLQERLS